MMYKILKLNEDKWTKFEFIHYYPGKFSLFLIFIGPSGVATTCTCLCIVAYQIRTINKNLINSNVHINSLFELSTPNKSTCL